MFYCHKPGHYKRDCRKRIYDLKRKEQNQNSGIIGNSSVQSGLTDNKF